MLGVCGGYQLLGHSYQLGEETIPGVGLLDLRTVRSRPAALDRERRDSRLRRRSTLAGFENHGGRTQLGAGQQPLGRVLRGYGNDGDSGFEGARAGT